MSPSHYDTQFYTISYYPSKLCRRLVISYLFLVSFLAWFAFLIHVLFLLQSAASRFLQLGHRGCKGYLLIETTRFDFQDCVLFETTYIEIPSKFYNLKGATRTTYFSLFCCASCFQHGCKLACKHNWEGELEKHSGGCIAMEKAGWEAVHG